jgi:hypothetical protein
MNRDAKHSSLISWAVLLLGMTAPGAWAHHSLSGQFDVTKHFEVVGTVSRVDWVNPHTYIFVDVKAADGMTKTYKLESLPVAMMRKAGVSKQQLMGDGKPVRISAYPARNGTPELGYLLIMKFADGREVQFAREPGT